MSRFTAAQIARIFRVPKKLLKRRKRGHVRYAINDQGLRYVGQRALRAFLRRKWPIVSKRKSSANMPTPHPLDTRP